MIRGALKIPDPGGCRCGKHSFHTANGSRGARARRRMGRSWRLYVMHSRNGEAGVTGQRRRGGERLCTIQARRRREFRHSRHGSRE